MKLKRFDVVELTNGNKATIMDIINNREYFVEIVDSKGNTIDKKNITEDEIEKIVYSK